MTKEDVIPSILASIAVLLFLAVLIRQRPIVQTVDLVSVIEKYEKTIKTKDAEILDLRETMDHYYEDNDKFINDRCVCVPYFNGASEPALTKQEICK